MRFFNLDLHIGVIGDVMQIFHNLGHEVTNWTLSAHSWVIGRPVDKVDVVNQGTWKGINQAMCDAFYERYKYELEQYDAFIVTYPPCFTMLYERWNKPIICVAATRYEAPFFNDCKAWERFNRYLRSKIDAGIIVPIANNKYDAAYAEYFTERKWGVIPSLCDYTNAPYTGTRDSSLYISKFKLPHSIPCLVSKEEHFKSTILSKIGKRLGLVTRKRGYGWQELSAFRSAVIVPYNASMMSLFELYASGVPMLFPSQEFAADLYAKYRQQGVLSELSFNQVANLPSRSSISCGSKDPNNYQDVSVMTHWIEKSDFYDRDNFNHLVYFDSFGEVEDLLESIDLHEIHSRMRQHHRVRSARAYTSWEAVLSRLSRQLGVESCQVAAAPCGAEGFAESTQVG